MGSLKHIACGFNDYDLAGHDGVWWRLQRRGGRGKTGGKLRDEDVIQDVLTTMSHDNLVFVAEDGSCHTIRAFDVPERSRAANGVPVAELLPKLNPGVSVAAVVPLHSTSQDQKTLLLLTTQGKAKRMTMNNLRCAAQ